MIPPSITIIDAAAPRASQLFALVGAAIMIPIILFYSGFSYWLFRGKVQPGAHYH
jgi:cytochrome d ubiquinol oxidase subunit II